MRILVNAVSVASAGGVGVLRGLVPAMAAASPGDTITALVPPGELSAATGLSNLDVIEQPRSGPRQIWRLLDDRIRLPRLARTLSPDVFFSLTDLGPSEVGCPHVLLLHNTWVTYRIPRRQIGFSLRDQLIYATYYPARFRRLWSRLTRVIVQTPVVAERLQARFAVPAERIAVIPPGCTMAIAAGRPRSDPVTSQNPLRLFWPARGYPHKNHDVLLPVCKELRRRGVADRVRIFTTLDPAADRRSAKLVRALRSYTDTVQNLGPLAQDQVRQWFDATDALFFPTLLESYSLVYLESAARARPVLTSDRDFARHACGADGYYFDPHDPRDICDRIVALANDIGQGRARAPVASSAGSWNQVASRVVSVLHLAAVDRPTDQTIDVRRHAPVPVFDRGSAIP
jgi:glycosyltransferase involved in cell wall biosynthesis